MIIVKQKLVRGCMKDMACEYTINRRRKLLCQIFGAARCINVLICIRLNFLWSNVLELATKIEYGHLKHLLNLIVVLAFFKK